MSRWESRIFNRLTMRMSDSIFTRQQHRESASNVADESEAQNEKQFSPISTDAGR
jgi:hypothetical protein